MDITSSSDDFSFSGFCDFPKSLNKNPEAPFKAAITGVRMIIYSFITLASENAYLRGSLLAMPEGKISETMR